MRIPGNNILEKTSVEKTFLAIETLLNKATLLTTQKKLNNVSIYAFGTEALRKAKNTDVFIKLFKEKFKNIPIEILKGEEEAAFASNALSSVYKPSLSMDIGGASTEFVYKKNGKTYLESLSIGARTYSKKNLSLINTRLESFKKKISADDFKQKKVVITGGTVSAFAAGFLKLKSFSQKKTEGLGVETDIIKSYLLYFKQDREFLKNFISFDPGREETLEAGLNLLLYIHKYLDFENFLVSNFGARFGYGLDKLENMGAVFVEWSL